MGESENIQKAFFVILLCWLYCSLCLLVVHEPSLLLGSSFDLMQKKCSTLQIQIILYSKIIHSGYFLTHIHGLTTR
jgi:hypothetical protein